MIIVLFFIVLFFYTVLIFWYGKGWTRTQLSQSEIIEHQTPFSIVVPYRNAGSSLVQLLDYLQTKKELPFEVVLVDDFSECVFEFSNTYSFPIQMLALQKFNTSLTPHKNNKKEALDYGITKSIFPYILCTDSDSKPSENWLEGMMQFTHFFKPKFAAGIHRYLKKNAFLNYFLALEQDNYTAISCAGIAHKYPTMCNGANMIFEKLAYYEVGGYEGLYHINGGDDMLLLHRIQEKFPDKTYFVKSLKTAVFSEAPSNFRELFAQRKRWLSKSFDYENKGVGVQMLIALMTNLIFIVSGFLAIVNPFFLLFSIWKLIVDACFLQAQKSFFEREKAPIWFTFSLFLYPFYTLFLTVDFFKSKLFNK